MRIHFIAIGGSAMHNLAIALHKKGYKVTGSDDEIFEPSRSRLEKYGLLPVKQGWFPEQINENIDIIILGMHARIDNPELLRAQELNLKIYSYPEYLFEQTKNKKRVVIGGSHGKTSITSMIMHVLKHNNINFDYMVGANIKGFDTMVNLEEKNDVAIFEGDEYLSSPIDMTPKFHWYKPHIAVLTGIAWDHINVFPTFENYVKQFEIFIKSIEKGGKLFWYEDDKELKKINKSNKDIQSISYNNADYFTDKEGNSCIKINDKIFILSIFGDHNFQNANAARLVCNELGINDMEFWNAMQTFEGAAKRLQLIRQNKETAFYIDFAHAPSKLKATINALKQKYQDRKLIACIELHTFSSLQANFIPQYKNTMENADTAIVYFNPEVIKHKRLPEISRDFVKSSFGDNVMVFTDTLALQQFLKKTDLNNTNILMMSSGNFNGIDFAEFAEELI
ncbi:MAG: Mur ligase domain-containing protein [Bacteroidales bacterium]|jgi:UDP-N-acetylmuramate: L-alanyl-gamma-D-glutamyl-meso-diaminopimelate ligase|nr:Mur ligase domain-containing protein [Bacteroidales bacterium]